MPAAPILVPLSGVIALAGGLSILLGYRANRSLADFALPRFRYSHHAQLSAVHDPMMAQIQMIMFMNL